MCVLFYFTRSLFVLLSYLNIYLTACRCLFSLTDITTRASKMTPKMHFHTKDKGVHLSPCLKKKCDGLTSDINAPIVEITKHEIERFNDPLAKPSKHIWRCDDPTEAVISGDGDVWVEILCQSTKTGEIISFFKSATTGKKVSNEPPTGASHVVFLRQSYIDKYIKN